MNRSQEGLRPRAAALVGPQLKGVACAALWAEVGGDSLRIALKAFEQRRLRRVYLSDDLHTRRRQRGVEQLGLRLVGPGGARKAPRLVDVKLARIRVGALVPSPPLSQRAAPARMEHLVLFEAGRVAEEGRGDWVKHIVLTPLPVAATLANVKRGPPLGVGVGVPFAPSATRVACDAAVRLAVRGAALELSQLLNLEGDRDRVAADVSRRQTHCGARQAATPPVDVAQII